MSVSSPPYFGPERWNGNRLGNGAMRNIKNPEKIKNGTGTGKPSEKRTDKLFVQNSIDIILLQDT